ncbi:hypothetical protein ASZ90_015780 [hydrocarbon metagenome]|uniref:Uncharacterized protein n=1 Tax=hydrocarbon metagenome TaxID=938273 RepID=A0A0W8F111_9ZZZZ
MRLLQVLQGGENAILLLAGSFIVLIGIAGAPGISGRTPFPSS